MSTGLAILTVIVVVCIGLWCLSRTETGQALYVKHYKRAMEICSSGTIVFVTCQIITMLSTVHSFVGGSTYPNPFNFAIDALRGVLGLEVFEIFHVACAMETTYASKLLTITLGPLVLLAASFLIQ